MEDAASRSRAWPSSSWRACRDTVRRRRLALDRAQPSRKRAGSDRPVAASGGGRVRSPPGSSCGGTGRVHPRHRTRRTRSCRDRRRDRAAFRGRAGRAERRGGRRGPGRAERAVELIVDGRPWRRRSPAPMVNSRSRSPPDREQRDRAAHDRRPWTCAPGAGQRLGHRRTHARCHASGGLMQPDAPTVAPSRPGPSGPLRRLPCPPRPRPRIARRQRPGGAAGPGGGGIARTGDRGGSGADATEEAGPRGRRDGGANPAGGAAHAAATAPRADPQPAEPTAVAAEPAPTKIARVEAGSRRNGSVRHGPGGSRCECWRLYLNETLIAPATVGRDGTVTVSIGRGVRLAPTGSGSIRSMPSRVRSATVRRCRFSAPNPRRMASTTRRPRDRDRDRDRDVRCRLDRRAAGTTGGPRDSPAAAAALPAGGTPGMAARRVRRSTCPGSRPSRIVRGDSLWMISRRTYGRGGSLHR